MIIGLEPKPVPPGGLQKALGPRELEKHSYNAAFDHVGAVMHKSVLSVIILSQYSEKKTIFYTRLVLAKSMEMFLKIK